MCQHRPFPITLKPPSTESHIFVTRFPWLSVTALESVLVTRYLSLATKLSDLPDSPESALVAVFSLACYYPTAGNLPLLPDHR